MLKDAWLKRLARISSSIDPVREPEKFEAAMQQVMLNTAVHACQLLPGMGGKQGSIPPALTNKVQEAAGQAVKMSLDQGMWGARSLRDAYREVYRSRQRLRDERSQELWADLQERIHLYLFRMLTTVSIAGVVLLTGYLAQRWGIPLPMLRLN